MPQRGSYSKDNRQYRGGRGRGNFNFSGDRYGSQMDDRLNFSSREGGGGGISKRGSFSGRRSRPYGGGGGGGYNDRRNFKPLGYQIRVMYAQKEDQMELMQSLEQKVGAPLNADNVNINDNNVEFVVTVDHIASKLERLSGQLKNTEGRKMAIFKKPWFGDRSLPAGDEDKLKELLNKHYNNDMKFLDLSKFLEKQEATNAGLKKFFIGQKAIATSVCKIIGSYIPQLEILDLSGNAMFNMYAYSDLPAKAPNLTKLNLSNNRMTDISNLDPIKKLKLTEIILEGNPLCGHYKDQSTYVK